MIMWILISLFVLFILWILLVPVILFIHTDYNRYMVSLPGIVKVSLVPSEELFHIRGWVFFFPFRYHPFRTKRKKKKEKQEREPKSWKPAKKGRIWKPSGGIRLGMDVVRSFRIRKLSVDMDTDDYVLNAWLIPPFSAVNSENVRFRTNFTGNLSLLLDMRIRIGSLLWILIRYKIKSFL